MGNNNIEILIEGVLKVVKNGEVVAIVHNDMKKRSQVIYACKEMGVEDIKNLFLMIAETKNDK